VNLFLDTSVVLAAIGSKTGASRFIIENAGERDWTLLTSAYVLSEVEANSSRLPNASASDFAAVRNRLVVVPDYCYFPWIAVFAPAKDRPILFTAAAWSDVLLTLDHHDFGPLLGSSFYHLAILRPGAFLAGQLPARR